MNIRQWRSILARTLSYFMFQGCVKCFGVILEGTAQFTHSADSMVGFSFMTIQGVAFLVGPATGWLMNRFSYRFLGIIGGTLTGVGFLCEAYFANKLWILIFSNTISGVGFGVLVLVTTVDMAETFGDSFGTAFSISNVVSNIGMVVMPLLVDYWLRMYGLSSAVSLLGAMMWNSIPCGFMLFKDENASSAGSEELIEMNDVSGVQERNGVQRRKNIFISHPALIFANFVRLLNLMIMMSWALYLVPLGTSKGYAPSTAVFLSSIGGAGITLGRIMCIAVYYFEWMHNFPLLLGGMIFCLLSMLVFNIADGFYYLCIASFVAGTMVALYSSWVEVYIKYVVCSRHFKEAMSWSNMFAGIGVILTGLISGLVQSFRGSFEDVFILLSVVGLLQLLSLIPTLLLMSPSIADCY